MGSTAVPRKKTKINMNNQSSDMISVMRAPGTVSLGSTDAGLPFAQWDMLNTDNRRHAVFRSILSVAVLFLTHGAFGQLISNGGFEDGLPDGWPPAQWTMSGDFYHWTNPSKAHTGSQYAYFGLGVDGITPLTNGSGSIEQSIPFMADTAPMTLSFWLWVASDEPSTSPRDHLYVEVLSNSGSLLATLADYSNADKAGQLSSVTPRYFQKTYSLASFTGQAIRIRFRGTTDASAGTIFRLDDVRTCTYFLWRPSEPLGPGRTNLSLWVYTDGGCPWTVISPENWISVIFGTSRLGGGSFNLILDANTSTSPRTGTIRLLGQAGVAVATAWIIQSGASNSGFLSGIRVSNGLVQFTLNGPQGGSYIVQASQDFLTWMPISTNTIPAGGFAPVADRPDPDRLARFYRAVPSAP